MRVHHLNCISSCPLGGGLMDGLSGAKLRGRLACHCLLVETGRELVLIDTGFGTRDCDAPRTRLSRFFLALTSPEFRREMTAVAQIERLGFDPRDVRHVVMSHLDFDHAGGLDDFPWARVHLLRVEKEAALAQRTLLDRMRYRPQQWSTQSQWIDYEVTAGDSWQGFGAVKQLRGIPPEIVMVPLLGHTFGHAGVAIRDGSGWLFYVGDAYFWHEEMAERPRCTPGLRFYQWMMQKDGKQRLENQRRLRELKRERGTSLRLFCAHDPHEFEHLAGRPLGEPAPGLEAQRSQPVESANGIGAPVHDAADARITRR